MRRVVLVLLCLTTQLVFGSWPAAASAHEYDETATRVALPQCGNADDPADQPELLWLSRPTCPKGDYDTLGKLARAFARLDDAGFAPRSVPSGRPTAPTPDVAFHHTSTEAAESIARTGLRPGGFATPNGGLSLLQAQIDLALPPNRGLPGGLVRIDVAGLRRAGFEIPEVTQVGRSYGMPGGGWEMRFRYEVPSKFLKSVPNGFPL